MTTKPKHTPGPWEWGEFSLISRGAKTSVAYVSHDCVDTNTNADAHLIASAPDLLAACEAALDPLAVDCHRVELREDLADQLRAAIAKARGE